MTAGYCQPGNCTSRPATSPLNSRALPSTGAGRPRRWQAAATANGSRSLVWMLTMCDMRFVPPLEKGLVERKTDLGSRRWRLAGSGDVAGAGRVDRVGTGDLRASNREA